jgi:beta-N-acetylhexosaminidase
VATTPRGRLRAGAGLLAAALLVARVPGVPAASQLDRAAERWVASTLARLSLDEKIGQLIVPSVYSTYLASDSRTYDELVRLVHEVHIGGVHLFGGRQPVPTVLLNPAYGGVILGQPLEAASLLNRLQAISKVPLLNTADFEAGVGFRVAGATLFPRAMALGATRDERIAYEVGRLTAIEGRALGVHVNFAPVVDVNNNARNPVINIRAFGEDPALVGALGAAYARGLGDGGMLATLKHFPGHGDTDVDSHLGLPLIAHPRERLERVELVPFRAGLAAGADAVMVAHIELPALDPTPRTPATFSRAIVTGLLREELGFRGLVYTDSMAMRAVADLMPPGEAAVRAVQAGCDLVLDSPDSLAAFRGLKAAVERGDLAEAAITRAVERILRAKARLGLHRLRAVNLETLPLIVGRRAHQAVADEAAQRALTLIKDERGAVPLRIDRGAAVLYLSALDYPSGWGIAAPSRTFIPELRRRWPNVTAIELSDRTAPSELDLVRAMAPRFEAIVVSIFVRAAAYSGRMDLAPSIVGLLRDLAQVTASRNLPYVAVLFGNPYTATFLPELPAMLLTYDFYDRAEAAAVRALAGEAPIGGKLPIALPGLFPLGHGLERPARAQTAAAPP